MLNPFSTRYTAPGTCRFLPPAEINSIESEFQERDLRGQIIGPHGSGKTTLAVALARKLEQTFSDIRLVTVRKTDTFKVIATTEFEFAARSQATRELLIIDGVELLSPLNRYLLIHASHQMGAGLILTTHRRVAGIQPVAKLNPSFQQFRLIVAGLQTSSEQQVSESDIEQAFLQSNGSYRTGLRLLYDEYARMIRGNRTANPAATIGAAE